LRDVVGHVENQQAVVHLQRVGKPRCEEMMRGTDLLVQTCVAAICPPRPVADS